MKKEKGLYVIFDGPPLYESGGPFHGPKYVKRIEDELTRLRAELDRLRGELKRTNSMWSDCARHLENSDKARDEQKADANRQWESAKGCAAHRVGPYRCPVLDPTPTEGE